MRISRLQLQHYRNIKELDLCLAPGLNIFYGDNAQGKTNLLEAVYLCATGFARRASHHRELIAFTQQEAHIRLLSLREPYANPTSSDDYDNKIDMHLKKDKPRGIAINGLPIKKLSQLFGVVLAVSFTPEDLQLVKAGPAERRRFMDLELCQLYPVYCHALSKYHHVLKQRNNLLKAIKHKKAQADTLFVWDTQLVEYGTVLYNHRKQFVQDIEAAASPLHTHVTGGKEALTLTYKPGVTPEDFMEKLEKNSEKDIALGVTGHGVHKDDLSFYINGMDARMYGSQGQQRTVSLSAKLAELALIKEKRHVTPVLLLDDVLSELDHSRQSFLMDAVSEVQSFITCTGLEDMLKTVKTQATVYQVKQGTVNKQ